MKKQAVMARMIFWLFGSMGSKRTTTSTVPNITSATRS